MHHIISQKKFRRLKMSAEASNISGWAKAGKPGVLVVQGQKQNIATFLERTYRTVQVLRYLEFHHVSTIPLEASAKLWTWSGLKEAPDMKFLILNVDVVQQGMKTWFRKEMGMSGS
ncbi:hypothetical protein PC9H_009557 [Pleurotus ostreatus]|uniref:Uncharacterized protein n=1 Tax=Pleurotus ostreatus TaxID=5322 RepID=A0A8H6ZRL2_PLEOS|nr:uncharacterized protein PC9H_009557 [Pleurotus ostreatus]KAF7424251.1 hypothetical protein PC9H_009557 [Pleurotus ostreatus]